MENDATMEVYKDLLYIINENNFTPLVEQKLFDTFYGDVFKKTDVLIKNLQNALIKKVKVLEDDEYLAKYMKRVNVLKENNQDISELEKNTNLQIVEKYNQHKQYSKKIDELFSFMAQFKDLKEYIYELNNWEEEV